MLLKKVNSPAQVDFPVVNIVAPDACCAFRPGDWDR